METKSTTTDVSITPGKVLEEIVKLKNPGYRSGEDYVVIACHAIMATNGFELVGLSESENYCTGTVSFKFCFLIAQNRMNFQLNGITRKTPGRFDTNMLNPPIPTC